MSAYLDEPASRINKRTFSYLKTLTVVNPVNQCPTVVVPAPEVERFEREFVSLFALARQRRRHFMVVKKELQNAGVEPAFDPKRMRIR